MGNISSILDMLESLDWLCIELQIKVRIFLFLYKIRKGLIEINDSEILDIMDRRINRRMERKYSEDTMVDGMIFFKGMKDFSLFGCEQWEHLDLYGFRKKFVREMMRFQGNNWGDCSSNVIGGRGLDFNE